MSVATRMGPSAGICHVLGYRSSFEHATRLGPHAVRTEPEEADDEQSDRNPLQRGDQAGRADVQFDEESSHLFETYWHQQRAKDAPDVVAAPAHDDGREEDDRLGVEPYRRRPDLDESNQDGPRQAGDQAADDEDRPLELDRGLGDGGGRDGVLTPAHAG